MYNVIVHVFDQWYIFNFQRIWSFCEVKSRIVRFHSSAQIKLQAFCRRVSNKQPLTREKTYNSTFNDLYHYSEKGNEFHTKITLCYTHGVLKVKLLSID